MFSRNKAYAALLLALVLLPALQLSSADGSSAAFDVEAADMGGSSITVKAGGTSSFDVIITNMAPFDDEGVADDIIVSMTASATDSTGRSMTDVSVSVTIKNDDAGYVVLSGQKSAVFTVSVLPDRYTDGCTCSLSYTYTVCDMSNTPLGDPVTVTKTLVINPFTDNEGFYNKFLGVFPNTLGGILGQSWFTALVSFAIIILLGVCASLVAAPVLSAIITTKQDADRKPLSRSLTKLFVMLFAVFGVSRALAVYGIDSRDYAAVDDVFLLIYAIVAAFIAWKVYHAILDRMSDRLKAKDNKETLDDYMSFKPLFLYIGKILISLVTVFSVMGTLGVDMAAIITSAGLITLGITFGAQQILAQFFAGLLILTTRPFKKGDLIQLDGSVVYRVRKVKVMDTELVNWDNSDVTIVPNNTLTSSNVKNLTRDTLRTKLYIYVGISYGSDVGRAQELMVEAAMENPHVITDGSSPVPSSSLEEFADSTLQMRLDVWIDDYNNYIDISSEIRKAMFDKFNAAGVTIDYPQIVVHTADRS